MVLEYEPSLAPLDKLVAGSLVFFGILPFVLFHFRFFPIGTNCAIFLGSALMVFTRVLSQEDVYHNIGKRDNLTTVLILLGIMLLVQYFEREQLVAKLVRRVFKPHFTFQNYIWRVCVISFVLSALFSSDACSILLTPVLLKVWEVHERPQAELESIVLAIATSANIGSVTTIFGNPHMALLASRTSLAPYQRSMLDLRRSLLYLGPAALLALLINLGFLVCHYKLRSGHIQKKKLISEASASSQEMSGLTRAHGSGNLTKLNGSVKNTNGMIHYDGGDEISFEQDSDSLQDERSSVPCQLETIPEDEVLEITSSRSTSIIDNEGLSHGTPEHNNYNTLQNEESQYSSTSSSSEDEEESRNPVHAQSPIDAITEERNSLTLDIEYHPSALQSQDLSCRSGGHGGSPTPLSPTIVLETHGLRLSEKSGIYRSTSAISAVNVLPLDMGLPNPGDDSHSGPFSPSDSLLFHAFISFMLVVIFALYLASSPQITFDIGESYLNHI